MTALPPAPLPPGISHANWRSAASNRWAFHNVDKLIATARVDNDPAAVAPLARASRPLAFGRLRQAVLRMLRTDAVVVLHDADIAFEWYAPGNGPHTPHILMSATKAIVGLLAELLQARGDIDLEAPVSTYLPQVAATAYRGATLRHLLDMRAGVELDAEQLRAYEIATQWAPAPPDDRHADLAHFFDTLAAPTTPHGTPFRYLSTNTDLLGRALEQATGQRIARLLSERLWQPMGAEDAAYITLDRAGLARCAGGLCTTARDLARVGQLIVDGGCRGPREVIPPPVLRDLLGGGDPAAWENGEWGAAFAAIHPRMRYRSGWYVVDREPRTLFAMGIHGQNLFIDPARRIVVAKLSSWKTPVDRLALWLTHRGVDALGSQLHAERD